jgi:hypothetical protein
MNLHREGLVAIEELEQEWKLPLRMMPAKKSLAVARHEFVQCDAGQCAIGDNALIVTVIDDFPTFGEMSAAADLLAEFRAKPSAAPNVLAKNRAKVK